MRDDYKIKSATQKIEAQVEVEVAKTIAEMSKHTKIPESELVNTALKRFIVTHKDFLPTN